MEAEAGVLEPNILMTNDWNQKSFDPLVVLSMHCGAGCRKGNSLDRCPSYLIVGVAHSPAEAVVDASNFLNDDALFLERLVVEVAATGRVHSNSQYSHLNILVVGRR